MVKMKVGAITIGQSPRADVVQELLPLMGEQVELIQAGALDGLTREVSRHLHQDQRIIR